MPHRSQVRYIRQYSQVLGRDHTAEIAQCTTSAVIFTHSTEEEAEDSSQLAEQSNRGGLQQNRGGFIQTRQT